MRGDLRPDGGASLALTMLPAGPAYTYIAAAYRLHNIS